MTEARNEYSVCQFFADDTYEYLGRYLPAEDAVRTAAQAIRSVGARLGTTRRVIITDGGDFTNWEWRHGEGIVYPPELAGLVVDSKDDTQRCPTCGEPYSRDPSPRASLCSNGFHCCRDCVWVEGSCVQSCAHHDEVERCADCARIAEEDGDILPPACERHGGKPPAKRGEG